MKRNFIAKRFQNAGTGLTLDTAALAKYKDIVDLSIGDTDFTTDEAIINAAFRDAKAGYTHYGDPKGDPELISAVCKAWEEDFDQSLPRDHVLVSASSCLGMSLAMFAILDPGDEVIVFSPYFALYRAQIELAGGVCVDVPTYAEEDYAISEERLRAAITPRTKAIIFNNPTNPTGMGYDLSTMEMLARVAKEYDLLIAADEIYTTYIYEGDFRPIRTLPGMAERTITLNSFSKNFLMTGWRVGVIIAEPEFLDVMNRINGSLVYSAPSISQRAGIQALEMRKEIREKYVTAYRDRIFYSADRIEKIPYLSLVRPKGTFYLSAGPRPPVRCLCVRSMFFHTQKAGGRKHLSPAGSRSAGHTAPHAQEGCTAGRDAGNHGGHPRHDQSLDRTPHGVPARGPHAAHARAAHAPAAQFHMAAFFLISGYTGNIYKKSLLEIIIEKFYKLMLPYIFINFILLIFSLIIFAISYYLYTFS